MDIKSLRIGDWVYNKHHGKNIRLTPYDFFTHTHNDFGEQELAPSAKPTIGRDLEPIAVTPEFLLKNGFVEMSKGRYVCHVMTGDGYFDIRLKDLNNGTWMLIISSWNKTTDTTSMFTASNAKMSVCELQHYIADCKIDKQIVL